QVPNAKQILPGNKAMNDQIGLLRERWRCLSPGGKCGSKYCFVQPDSANHFVLGFCELESWVAAILKGPQFATIDMPPNNNLFNALDPWTVAARSPLLQCHLQSPAKFRSKSCSRDSQSHQLTP
ncbi:hypothetical protein L208DRAFT_1241522, partial [Tricholoma matsutake]